MQTLRFPRLTFATQLLVTFVCMMVSTLTFAATVKKIDRKKKLVLIDEGKSGTLTKTSKVCFKDADGADIGCGKVSKVKASSATIKVSAKVLKKIKKGFEVVITEGEAPADGDAAPADGDAAPADGDAAAAPADGEASADGAAAPAKGKKGKKDKTAKTKGGKWRNNIKLAYILTPKGASTFNRLSYLAPAKNDAGTVQPSNTLWSSVGAVSQSLLGFGLEGEFGIGASSSVAIGFKQKKYSEFKVESDYDVKDGSHYAETSETASATGFWFDFYYLEFPVSPSFIFRIGNGIDYESSTVNLKVTHKYDGKNPDVAGNQEFEIATATSKLNTIALRTVLNTHYFIDPVGLNFALNILLPLAASESFTGTVSDPNATSLTGIVGADDLKAALGHKKAGVGVEALFGLYFAF